jgi:hypothetical protein
MSLRLPHLQQAKTLPEDQEAYLERIASAQGETPSNDSTSSEDEAPSRRVLPDWTSERAIPTRPRSMIRTLFKWFLRFMLVGMVLVLAGLILYLWGPWAQPSSVPVEPEPVSSMTAKESRLVANPTALKWAEDAQLVSLSATWDAGQPFQDGQGDWSLVYYSPAKAATALISVIDGTAAIVGTHGVADSIAVSGEKAWQIDSPDVIEKMRVAGGDEFLRSQPDSTVSMSLDMSRDAVWSVRFIDQMSRRVFAARISIDSGEIIEIQQTS